MVGFVLGVGFGWLWRIVCGFGYLLVLWVLWLCLLMLLRVGILVVLWLGWFGWFVLFSLGCGLMVCVCMGGLLLAIMVWVVDAVVVVVYV